MDGQRLLPGHTHAASSEIGAAIFGARSAIKALTMAFIISTETALPICLTCSVFVPAKW